METIQLSRDELYEQVWNEPITKLAKRYGLSDVGLAKTCKRHKIPIPGRGYWAKKASGKATIQAELPPLPDGENYFLSTITFQTRPHVEMEQTEEINAQIVFEKKAENLITVSSSLESPHPLVTRTSKSLQSAKADERGVCKPKTKGCLDIRVAPDSFDRALRIMDALVKAIEKRGFKLCQNSKIDGGVSVGVNGEMLSFILDERVMRNDHLLNEEEKKKIAKDRWYLHSLPKYDYVPTGKLSLRIEGWYDSRSTWGDAKIQRVENCLNDFLAGLVRTAAEKKATREKREQEERERQEEQCCREERARLRKEEQARVVALENDTENWHKSQRIRAYMGAVRGDAIEKHGAVVPGSELDEWLAWAALQADRLDPLVESPLSILDEPDESPWYLR